MDLQSYGATVPNGSESVCSTWDDAAARWLQETSHKTTHKDDRSKFAWLAPHFSGIPLEQISGDRVSAVGLIKAKQTSNVTANRYLALIRAVLRRAHEVWQWIERRPRILLYPEKPSRTRWLTPADAKRLLQELPQHQQDVVIFALATGLRHSNVVRLQWSHIDLSARRLIVPAEESKSRRPIRIPLNEVAIAVIDRARGHHSKWVFTYRSKPIRCANTRAWRLALERAGIENFRWHDLRHTWASWQAQAGTPLYVLQELGGWQSEIMVRRYAHLTPSLFAGYAEAVTHCLE